MGTWVNWQTGLPGLFNILMGMYFLYQGHNSEAMLAFSAGMAGLRARQVNVTSEQAGLKGPAAQAAAITDPVK